MNWVHSGSLEEQTSDTGSRNELIESYSRYVYTLVHRLMRSLDLPPSLREECISSGFLGLVEAAERYRPECGKDFKAYAFFRIRGAVIDGIRAQSNLSSKAYKYAKALNAIWELEEQEKDSGNLGNKTSNVKLARILTFAAKGALAFRLGEKEAEKEGNLRCDDNNPESEFEKRQEAKILHKLVATLPRRERIIIEEYYFRGKQFTQIASEHAGISRSWISRLHTRALERLFKSYKAILVRGRGSCSILPF